MVIGSIVFVIGSIMQVVNSHSLSVFFVGRVIGGLGVGACTILVPMFSAEMTPKAIRERLGSCLQIFFAGGVSVSSWYGHRDFSSSSS